MSFAALAAEPGAPVLTHGDHSVAAKECSSRSPEEKATGCRSPRMASPAERKVISRGTKGNLPRMAESMFLTLFAALLLPGLLEHG
jgi:hypothetical protein